MKRSLLVLPVLVLAQAALAQNDFDTRVADFRLLQAKAIQSDVKISAAQLKKMNAAADAHRQRLEAYQKTLQALGKSQPEQARLAGLAEQLKKEVFAVLSPTQIKRLRELTLQRLGLISLTDKQVGKRVGLSDAQIEKLKATYQSGREKFVALQAKIRNPILAPYANKKPKDQAEAKAWQAAVMAKLKAAEPSAKPKLLAIGKQTDAAMLAVLTGPQRQAWTALKGTPFKGK